MVAVVVERPRRLTAAAIGIIAEKNAFISSRDTQTFLTRTNIFPKSTSAHTSDTAFLHTLPISPSILSAKERSNDSPKSKRKKEKNSPRSPFISVAIFLKRNSKPIASETSDIFSNFSNPSGSEELKSSINSSVSSIIRLYSPFSSALLLSAVKEKMTTARKSAHKKRKIQSFAHLFITAIPLVQ